jgi:large repetitive protein
MNIYKQPFVRVFAVLLLLSVSLALESRATIYTLSHKNSEVKFDIGAGGDKMYDWKINGADQLNQSGFYYRVGSTGPEYPLENLSAVPVVNAYQNLPTVSRLDLTYADANYSVRTLYTLTGQTVGTGGATLAETITVANTSGSAVEFHLFQYNDFDLLGLLDGQNVVYTTNSVNGQYSIVTQTFGSSGIPFVQEKITSASPVIGHFEAATFSQTLVKLTDGDADDLDDTVAAGPENVTFAYQWDVVLAPGGTFQISKLLEIKVPEPTSAALITLGGLVLSWATRRRMVRQP